MRFGILGPLDVTDGERRVPIGGPKRPALLTALLVDANKVVSMRRLSSVLWPEAAPTDEVNALHTQVSRLRSVLEPTPPESGESRLVFRGQGYMLRVEEDELDALAFEAGHRAATAAFEERRWQDAIAIADTALARWQGPALEEFAHLEFAASRAAQLNELRLRTVECRADASLALGRHRELVSDLEDVVAHHPLRERLWYQLMLALYRSDRQSEALRAFQRVRELLADELGISPGTELVRLEQSILEQDAALDLVPHPETVPTAPAAQAERTEGRVTRQVTFLFTEIENSAALWDRDPAAMTTALQRHDDALEAAIKGRGGEVVARPGEGFCVVFDIAADALACALEAQRQVHADTASATNLLRVRMAVHTGEAELRGGNYFGTSVNRVARMRDAAHGGQILVSAATRELAVDTLPSQATLTDIGQWLFEGFSRSERIYQLSHPGIETGFPPLRSGRPHTGTIPRHPTSFVGRQLESERTVAALQAGSLVTITGEGGVGKTRLALEILHRASVSDYPDGVWFCDVSPIDSADGLAEAMAAALQVSTAPGSNIRATVVGALRHSRLLLLVDNSEHMREAVAELVAEILRAGPEAKVLATSRAPLRTSGEQVIQLDPLGLPDRHATDATELATAPAVRLLVDRARAAGASVAEDDPALVDIAYRLDGMPLAIELAAPRLAIMSTGTLASRLDRRFDLLTGPALPRRQRTLRATLDWSFELLSSNAQRLFAALSVFRGGFTLDTAEMIAAAVDLDPDDVAPLIADLADQSMIRAELPAQGNTRYRMLDTMQAYAAEYLTLMERQEAVHARHAAYFVELAERAALYRRGPLEPAWVIEVETEFDNMRAALRWAVESGHPADALRLVAALADDAMMRERFEIGRWAVELAEIPTIATHPLRAIALALGGNIALQEYRLDDARRLSVAALALEEETGCRPSWIARNTLAILAAADSSDDFRAHLQAMAEIGATTGDRFAAAMADWTRVLMAVVTGHPDRGVDAAEHLLALGTDTGNPSMLAMGLLCHGQVVAPTDPELAAQEYHDGLTAASSAHNILVGQQCLRAAEALRARSGDRPAALESLRGVAQRFEQSGNVAQQLQTVISMLDSLVALDALDEAATICAALSRTPGRFTAVCQMVDRAVVEKLPRDRYLAARRAGTAMTPSDVVAFASGLVKDLASER